MERFYECLAVFLTFSIIIGHSGMAWVLKNRMPQSLSKIFEDRTASWTNVCVRYCIPNSCYYLSSTDWFPFCYILHYRTILYRFFQCWCLVWSNNKSSFKISLLKWFCSRTVSSLACNSGCYITFILSSPMRLPAMSTDSADIIKACKKPPT